MTATKTLVDNQTEAKVSITVDVKPGQRLLMEEVVREKPQQKRTYVIAILDSSGSMWPIAEPTIRAYNEWMESIKRNAEKGGDTKVSLWLFGEKKQPVREVFRHSSPSDLRPLTSETYIPSGNTPLYDAVGFATDTALRFDGAQDENTSFLVHIVTDGYENDSKWWNKESIARRIKELTATDRWTFTYAGANQDLSKISKEMGIPIQNTVRYEASGAGVNELSGQTVAASDAYFGLRSTGISSSKDLYGATNQSNSAGSTGFSEQFGHLSAAEAKRKKEEKSA